MVRIISFDVWVWVLILTLVDTLPYQQPNINGTRRKTLTKRILNKNIYAVNRIHSVDIATVKSEQQNNENFVSFLGLIFSLFTKNKNNERTTQVYSTAPSTIRHKNGDNLFPIHDLEITTRLQDVAAPNKKYSEAVRPQSLLRLYGSNKDANTYHHEDDRGLNNNILPSSDETSDGMTDAKKTAWIYPKGSFPEKTSFPPYQIDEGLFGRPEVGTASHFNGRVLQQRTDDNGTDDGVNDDNGTEDIGTDDYRADDDGNGIGDNGRTADNNGTGAVVDMTGNNDSKKKEKISGDRSKNHDKFETHRNTGGIQSGIQENGNDSDPPSVSDANTPQSPLPSPSDSANSPGGDDDPQDLDIPTSAPIKAYDPEPTLTPSLFLYQQSGNDGGKSKPSIAPTSGSDRSEPLPDLTEQPVHTDQPNDGEEPTNEPSLSELSAPVDRTKQENEPSSNSIEGPTPNVDPPEIVDTTPVEAPTSPAEIPSGEPPDQVPVEEPTPQELPPPVDNPTQVDAQSPVDVRSPGEIPSPIQEQAPEDRPSTIQEPTSLTEPPNAVDVPTPVPEPTISPLDEPPPADEPTPVDVQIPIEEPTPVQEPSPIEVPTSSPVNEPTPFKQPTPVQDPTPVDNPTPTPVEEPTPAAEPIPIEEPAPVKRPSPAIKPTHRDEPTSATSPTPVDAPDPRNEPSESPYPTLWGPIGAPVSGAADFPTVNPSLTYSISPSPNAGYLLPDPTPPITPNHPSRPARPVTAPEKQVDRPVRSEPSFQTSYPWATATPTPSISGTFHGSHLNGGNMNLGSKPSRPSNGVTPTKGQSSPQRTPVTEPESISKAAGGESGPPSSGQSQVSKEEVGGASPSRSKANEESLTPSYSPTRGIDYWSVPGYLTRAPTHEDQISAWNTVPLLDFKITLSSSKVNPQVNMLVLEYLLEDYIRDEIFFRNILLVELSRFGSSKYTPTLDDSGKNITMIEVTYRSNKIVFEGTSFPPISLVQAQQEIVLRDLLSIENFLDKYSKELEDSTVKVLRIEIDPGLIDSEGGSKNNGSISQPFSRSPVGLSSIIVACVSLVAGLIVIYIVRNQRRRNNSASGSKISQLMCRKKCTVDLDSEDGNDENDSVVADNNSQSRRESDSSRVNFLPGRLNLNFLGMDSVGSKSYGKNGSPQESNLSSNDNAVCDVGSNGKKPLLMMMISWIDNQQRDYKQESDKDKAGDNAISSSANVDYGDGISTITEPVWAIAARQQPLQHYSDDDDGHDLQPQTAARSRKSSSSVFSRYNFIGLTRMNSAIADDECSVDETENEKGSDPDDSKSGRS